MKAIIVDSANVKLNATEHAEMMDWAKSLGLDVNLALPLFVLTPGESGSGNCVAHFSLKRQRDGRDYVLPGTNRIDVDFDAYEIEIPDKSWPSWFGEVVEVPDMPIATLMETLAVAAEAQGNTISAIWARRDEAPAVAE